MASFVICIRLHKNISSFTYFKKFLDMLLEEDKHVLVWLLKGDAQQNDITINLVSLAVENHIPKILEILFENFFYSCLIFNLKITIIYRSTNQVLSLQKVAV